eukprot:11187727-Lingulodinium_polyedra.AAC.1
MMRVVETGRTPTMRYIYRTHRVAVAWLRERFSDVASRLNLTYEQSCRMCADLYAQMFTDPLKWIHGCQFVG